MRVNIFQTYVYTISEIGRPFNDRAFRSLYRSIRGLLTCSYILEIIKHVGWLQLQVRGGPFDF